MDDGWLELDGIAHADLPGWALAAPAGPLPEGLDDPSPRLPRVVLSEHGIAWLERKRGTIASWPDVLGVVVHAPAAAAERAVVYVLVPRRPPLPPWLVVPPAMLPAEERGAGLDAFGERVRARIQHSGYRAAAERRPALPRGELVRRVLARAPIPGAVEVPVGAGPADDLHARLDLGTALGTVGGGVAGSIVGTALLGAALGPAGVLVAATVGAALTGALVTYRDFLRRGSLGGRTSRPRVLVLAPDGCVVGFVEGVRGFSWDQVGKFVAGRYVPHAADPAPRDCLEVRAPDGELVGRIDASWFDGPLALIVAIAEAYRRRAVGG